MILRQIRDVYVSRLEQLYPEQEAISIFKILCEDLLQMSKSDLMISGEEPLSHLKEGVMLKSLEQLMEGKPVQYITGTSHFYGHKFKVNASTLIPRQETEELVHWILEDYKHQSVSSILDIGTGSGCIGISLGYAFAKANSSSDPLEIKLIDISNDALQVAANNAESIVPNVPVICMQQDILSVDKLESYDIIVSNPPYVRDLEKSELHTNVIDHEPHSALFVSDEDPLVFYKKILELVNSSKNGSVYFEINQYIPKDVQALASELGFQSEIRKDLSGNHRMMKCWK